MKDIQLLETCTVCGAHIVLMESVNTDTGKLMLVKRCVCCANYLVTEVIEVCASEKVQNEGDL